MKLELLILKISQQLGITDGLVGYWPFDSNSKDYSGNNYNGTNYGSVPILDNATYFNGAINSYIKLPNSTVTNLGDFTFSFFRKIYEYRKSNKYYISCN